MTDSFLKKDKLLKLLGVNINLYYLSNQGKIEFKMCGKQRSYSVKSVEDYIKRTGPEDEIQKDQYDDSCVYYGKVQDNNMLTSHTEEISQRYPGARIIIDIINEQQDANEKAEEADEKTDERKLNSLIREFKVKKIKKLIFLSNLLDPDILVYIKIITENYSIKLKLIDHINIHSLY